MADSGDLLAISFHNLLISEGHRTCPASQALESKGSRYPTAAYRFGRIQLGHGIPDCARLVVNLVLDDEVWSREGAFMDLDAGRARISVLYFQQGRIEREPNVKSVEIGHVFDDDVHVDAVANLDFGCDGIEAYLCLPLSQPQHCHVAEPKTEQDNAHKEQKHLLC